MTFAHRFNGMGNSGVDRLPLPLFGKAQQFLERQSRPLQTGSILVECTHWRDFARVADENAVGFARTADQRRQGVDACGAGLHVKDGNGIAADIQLMRYARGNDGSAAGQP
jgi:hypothetical protein